MFKNSDTHSVPNRQNMHTTSYIRLFFTSTMLVLRVSWHQTSHILKHWCYSRKKYHVNWWQAVGKAFTAWEISNKTQSCGGEFFIWASKAMRFSRVFFSATYTKLINYLVTVRLDETLLKIFIFLKLVFKSCLCLIPVIKQQKSGQLINAMRK